MRDENEAIDKNNIVKGARTRGAKPNGPGYSEGLDEDQLPSNVMKGQAGTSSTK